MVLLEDRKRDLSNIIKAEMRWAAIVPNTQNHTVNPTALKKDETHLSGLWRKSAQENKVDQSTKLSDYSQRIANLRKANTRTSTERGSILLRDLI